MCKSHVFDEKYVEEICKCGVREDRHRFDKKAMLLLHASPQGSAPKKVPHYGSLLLYFSWLEINEPLGRFARSSVTMLCTLLQDVVFIPDPRAMVIGYLVRNAASFFSPLPPSFITILPLK